MQSTPSPVSTPDLFSSSRHLATTPLRRTHHYSASPTPSSLSITLDPHDLVANLNAARAEQSVMEDMMSLDSPDGAETSAMRNTPGSVSRRGMDLRDMSRFSAVSATSDRSHDRSRGQLDSSTSFHRQSRPSQRQRNHSLLYNIASDQGNSGLISVSPKLVGPPLNRYGLIGGQSGTGANDDVVDERRRNSSFTGERGDDNDNHSMYTERERVREPTTTYISLPTRSLKRPRESSSTSLSSFSSPASALDSSFHSPYHFQQQQHRNRHRPSSSGSPYPLPSSSISPHITSNIIAESRMHHPRSSLPGNIAKSRPSTNYNRADLLRRAVHARASLGGQASEGERGDKNQRLTGAGDTQKDVVDRESGTDGLTRGLGLVDEEHELGLGMGSGSGTRAKIEAHSRDPRFPDGLEQEAEIAEGVEDEVLFEGELEEEDEDPSWAMIARMRTWRQDAIMQHLYETAGFWGDKVFSWTGEPNDAFWLAQTYFLQGQYLRAELILTSSLPPSRMPMMSERFSGLNDNINNENALADNTIAEDEIKEKKRKLGLPEGFEFETPTSGGQFGTRHQNPGRNYDEPEEEEKVEDEQWLGNLLKTNSGGIWGALKHDNNNNDDDDDDENFDDNDDLRTPGTSGRQQDWNKTKNRMCDWSLACRYLAGLSMMYQEKFLQALKLIGESNPFGSNELNGPKVPSKNGDLKLQASICRMRGMLHLRLNSLEAAKECYMEALALDVRNYDVFKELVNDMMSPEEEWDFIQSLSYREQLAEEDAMFVKQMYTSRLSKGFYQHLHAHEIRQARQNLAKEYNLGQNCDVMAAMAEDLFVKHRLEDCYLVTSKIVAAVPNHETGLQLHLACLAQIPRLASSLFMLAHKLVEQEPNSAVTWYAVALWYYAGQRWPEARRYLAATHDEDSRFGPAWIAFAHTLAFENEHEQAITAYSTTARLFPGSYFPHVCIGMEYLQLSNNQLAEEYFLTAYSLCPTDPLLLNELGVTAYNIDQYDRAIGYFERAISAAHKTQGIPSDWSGTYCNLGHAYRRMKNYEKSMHAYNGAVRLDVLNVHAWTSMGMICQDQGDLQTAIDYFHQALSIAPQDAIATVLLDNALPDMALLSPTIPRAKLQEARTGLVPGYPSSSVDDPTLSPPLPPFLPEEVSGHESSRMSLEGSTMDLE